MMKNPTTISLVRTYSNLFYFYMQHDAFGFSWDSLWSFLIWGAKFIDCFYTQIHMYYDVP